MAHSEAMAIVRATLALRQSHPSVPALEVVDLAVDGRQHSDSSFDDADAPGGDWTDPGGPFGAVLAEAFGSTLSVGQLQEWVNEGPDAAAAAAWQEAIDRFAERYRLWNQG